jgi:hypothetical protein
MFTTALYYYTCATAFTSLARTFLLLLLPKNQNNTRLESIRRDGNIKIINSPFILHTSLLLTCPISEPIIWYIYYIVIFKNGSFESEKEN